MDIWKEHSITAYCSVSIKEMNISTETPPRMEMKNDGYGMTAAVTYVLEAMGEMPSYIWHEQ